MDEFSKLLIAWFKKQRKNAIIEWHSDHLSQDRQWGASWIDARIPEADEECNTSWSLTLNPSGSLEEQEDIWEFTYPHDLDVHCVYDPEPPNYWYILEFPLPKGTNISPEQDFELEKVLHEGPNRSRRVEGAWSVKQINEAFEWWVREHASRPDIRFKWNPEIGLSEMVQKADAAFEAIQNGADTYDLGNGIHAASGVMDFLLGLDPDISANLMEDIKKRLGKPDK